MEAGRCYFSTLFQGFVFTLRPLIIVPGGLVNRGRAGPGGPGTGFGRPRGGFLNNRRSGLPLRALLLKLP